MPRSQPPPAPERSARWSGGVRGCGRVRSWTRSAVRHGLGRDHRALFDLWSIRIPKRRDHPGSLRCAGIRRRRTDITLTARRRHLPRWSAADAEDVKFTYDVLKTNKVQTTRTAKWRRTRRGSGRSADRPCLLSEGFAVSERLTALGILPEHLLGNSPNLNEDPLIGSRIGSSPFKFVEWAKDDHITLEANDAYWGGRGKHGAFHLRPREGSSRTDRAV